MSDLAGDIVDVLDHLGTTQAAVFGCSMGGYIVFEMLKSAPRYINAVGLVSTRAGADNEEGRKNRQKMIDQVDRDGVDAIRSEEHTSELQSPCNLVCRLLLEKKNNKPNTRS